MKVTIQLFAGARAAAGRDRVAVELSESATVGELRRSLTAAAPELSRFGTSLWVAVNGDYAGDAEVVPADAEVACFPPVSGG